MYKERNAPPLQKPAARRRYYQAENRILLRSRDAANTRFRDSITLREETESHPFSFFPRRIPMSHFTKFPAALCLTLGLMAALPTASQAFGERPAVVSDNHYYFVHAGNCSRSLYLAAACTCPDEAAYLAEQLGEKHLHCWVSTTPDTYASYFNSKQ